jgi:phage/plasmid-associated DNA primase
MSISLKQIQIALECGQCVKSHISMFNNKQRYDEMVGWTSGANEVNQHKDYTYSNAKCFESNLKKNRHNGGHPPSALSIYYLSQEPDFSSWYNIKTAMRLGAYTKCKRQYGHVDGLLELHKTWDSTNYFKEPTIEEKIQSTINNIIDKQLTMDHYICANLLISIYQSRFKCASIQHNMWYEFENHKWIKMEDAYVLRNLITETLEPFLENKKKMLSAEKEMHLTLEPFLENKKKMLSAEKEMHYKIKCIGKIVKSLHNNTFKTGIVKEYATLAYDPNFLTKLDENPNLLCFKNGIYELTTGIFRDGHPEDYISLSTNCSYKIPDAQLLKELNECFLDKIHPNPKIKSYSITALSTCLSGLITEGNAYILNGKGANGKSKFMELFKLSMGELFRLMDVRLLTEKRPKTIPISSMADKKGVRACAFDEPSTSDNFNANFLYSFTDKDCINSKCRALYQEPIYFKAQMKSFLLCSRLPTITNADDDIWGRLKVIPFDSKFVRNYNFTSCVEGLPDNYFYFDVNISDKFREWADPFMYMLIEAHKEYLIHGLVEPEEVTRATNTYREQCDIYKNFIKHSLEKTSKIQDGISLLTLHNLMKSWYKSAYDGECPDMEKLGNYLKNMSHYDKTHDILHGYRIKTLAIQSPNTNKSIPCENPISPKITSTPDANIVELLSSQMKSNKISKIQITNGKTVVEYDF